MQTRARGLALLSVLVAAAFLLNSIWSPISPLTSSVVIGFLVANLLGWPRSAEAGTRFAAKHLMRTGVALLGMELSFSALAGLGLRGLLAVVFTVTSTIFGIRLLARLFGLSDELGLLIGVGYGICGASAVAAVQPQTEATEQEASYAIGLVAICGSLSIVVLPVIGAALGLSDHLFGLWSGAAVHDVGQVVATASVRGDVALHAAIIVKLARVAMLAPVVLLVSMRRKRNAGAVAMAEAPKVAPIPAFVVGFLVLAAVNSLGVVPTAISDAVVMASKILIGFGLAALGVGVRWRELRAVGHRPLLLGLSAWVLVAAMALLAVRYIA